MQFKDAAYEVLKEAGKPLHYNEITDLALGQNILETAGQTPHATMGALLYTDTLKENSRFRRGDEKGTFALADPAAKGIKQQIETIQKQIRQDLRKHLLKMHPQKFEELIRSLLEEMGFDEAETTAYRNDKGVDVRGILKTNPLSTTKVAIQAKRWTANVGSGVVRDLRGSLRMADAEQGLIITPSDFTADAREEAESSGKTPITLINGLQLVDLLIQYQVGVKQEQYTVFSIDAEYWSEVLGVQLEEAPQVVKQKATRHKINFPVAIQAQHKGQVFTGKLLDLRGSVRFRDQEYPTPTTAAKVIVTDWKEVNGWDFWRYLNPSNGNWEKIGKLR
jgi:restriction system protein